MAVRVISNKETPISVIDIVHDNIHGKNYFDYQKKYIDIANDGYIYISIRPQEQEMHLTIDVDADGKTYIDSYVDSTWTADGDLQTTFNRYINNAPDADAVIYANGTVNVLGVHRFDKLLAAGSKNFTSGGTKGSRVESIIDAGKELTLVIQNKSDTTGDIGVTLEWYQVVED